MKIQEIDKLESLNWRKYIEIGTKRTKLSWMFYRKMKEKKKKTKIEEIEKLESLNWQKCIEIATKRTKLSWKFYRKIKKHLLHNFLPK